MLHEEETTRIASHEAGDNIPANKRRSRDREKRRRPLRRSIAFLKSPAKGRKGGVAAIESVLG